MKGGEAQAARHSNRDGGGSGAKESFFSGKLR